MLLSEHLFLYTSSSISSPLYLWCLCPRISIPPFPSISLSIYSPPYLSIWAPSLAKQAYLSLHLYICTYRAFREMFIMLLVICLSTTWVTRLLPTAFKLLAPRSTCLYTHAYADKIFLFGSPCSYVDVDVIYFPWKDVSLGTVKNVNVAGRPN